MKSFYLLVLASSIVFAGGYYNRTLTTNYSKIVEATKIEIIYSVDLDGIDNDRLSQLINIENALNEIPNIYYELKNNSGAGKLLSSGNILESSILTVQLPLIEDGRNELIQLNSKIDKIFSELDIDINKNYSQFLIENDSGFQAMIFKEISENYINDEYFKNLKFEISIDFSELEYQSIGKNLIKVNFSPVIKISK